MTALIPTTGMNNTDGGSGGGGWTIASYTKYVVKQAQKQKQNISIIYIEQENI
jgi:hypothetical protein